MRHKIQKYNLDWEVESAGTSGWHVGNLPDSRSIEVAKKNNIDLTQQRGRQFIAEDLDEFDLILTMDTSNFQNVKKLATSAEQEKKIHLIMNFVSPNMNQVVPDPYYGDYGFENVFEMLDVACEQIIEKFQR